MYIYIAIQINAYFLQFIYKFDLSCLFSLLLLWVWKNVSLSLSLYRSLTSISHSLYCFCFIMQYLERDKNRHRIIDKEVQTQNQTKNENSALVSHAFLLSFLSVVYSITQISILSFYRLDPLPIPHFQTTLTPTYVYKEDTREYSFEKTKPSSLDDVVLHVPTNTAIIRTYQSQML